MVVCIVLLNPHAREIQGALLVDVMSIGRICSRSGVSAICLVRLGDCCENMFAFPEHRDENAVIGVVSVAVIGVVMKKGVPLLNIRMNPLHRFGEQFATDDVDRQSFCGSD